MPAPLYEGDLTAAPVIDRGLRANYLGLTVNAWPLRAATGLIVTIVSRAGVVAGYKIVSPPIVVCFTGIPVVRSTGYSDIAADSARDAAGLSLYLRAPSDQVYLVGAQLVDMHTKPSGLQFARHSLDLGARK